MFLPIPTQHEDGPGLRIRATLRNFARALTAAEITRTLYSVQNLEPVRHEGIRPCSFLPTTAEVLQPGTKRVLNPLEIQAHDVFLQIDIACLAQRPC